MTADRGRRTVDRRRSADQLSKKKRVGVVPSCFRNIDMNALVLLYPASRAAPVTFSPRRKKLHRIVAAVAAAGHLLKVIFVSVMKRRSIVRLLAPAVPAEPLQSFSGRQVEPRGAVSDSHRS